jgi:hypothetical protein
VDHATQKKDLAERRRHERFRVEEGAWAVVRPFSGTNPRGQIIDISAGGLAFSYTAAEKELDDAFELDICFADRGFCLRRARFSTVSEVPMGNMPRHSQRVNRLGVAFQDLTEEQMTQLNYFIENHTTGKV